MEGLIAIYPDYPHGTLIFFKTRNNAVECRNILRHLGVQTGKYICEVEYTVSEDGSWNIGEGKKVA